MYLLPILHNKGSCQSCGWALQGCSGVQSHLALCCKATLPILCMGRVTMTTDERKRERPLLQAARCLTKQPGSVSHLMVSSSGYYGQNCADMRHVIDLRCATI